uniref:Uncharacterized protein n=1 Tax=Trichogramma kaykai TaxID=54128 RepID=A0ABD2XEE6_9HYME
MSPNIKDVEKDADATNTAIIDEVSLCLGDLRENKAGQELHLINEVSQRVLEYLRLGFPKEEKKRDAGADPKETQGL